MGRMKYTPIIGRIIDGRYRLEGLLGDGNMGEVYRAHDLEAGRTVALKVMKAREPGGDDTAMKRFRREAKASSAIDSEHLVRLLGAGVDAPSDRPYLVIEYLVGEDVGKALERLGPLAPDAALRIAAQACAGLSRAHAVGIVHRDIKPANLFLAEQGDGRLVVKVLDFGVAKLRAEQGAENTGLTGTGHLLGSPLYMAPEQVRGSKAVDHRADLWSLGVVLYRALAGRAPNQHLETLAELVIAACTDAPTSLQEVAPWVSADVAELVHRALEMDPDRRFSSAAEMLAALRIHLPFGFELRPDRLRGLTTIERARVESRESGPLFIRVLPQEARAVDSVDSVDSEPEPPPSPADTDAEVDAPTRLWRPSPVLALPPVEAAPPSRPAALPPAPVAVSSAPVAAPSARASPSWPRRLSPRLAGLAIVVGLLAGLFARWATHTLSMSRW